MAKRLDPAAAIEVGVWVNGPDGRRDLDVLVRPNEGGRTPIVVIECKDWNKPIGIGLIDALESKRRDLGAVVAMICSNSGFTDEALRKAARVGIPALAALIEGDSRIRVVVRQRIYTRIVSFIHHTPTFRHQILSDEQQAALAGLATSELTYEGRSLEAWVAARLLEIGGFSTRSRSVLARHTFREPLPVVARGIELLTTRIDIRTAFTVQWMTQVAEIGASQGMYNYLRQWLILGPGPYQVHLKNVNTETWGTPVDVQDVPPHLLVSIDKRTTPRPAMELGMLKNMPQSNPNDAPDLSALIESSDVLDEEEVKNDSTTS